MKLKPVVDDAGTLRGYAFYCPGCEGPHVYYVAGNLVWSFDGNLESPTFSPSLLNTAPNHGDPKQQRCHLHLTAGKLQFCTDCSHDFAGKTVELPDYPYGGSK